MLYFAFALTNIVYDLICKTSREFFLGKVEKVFTTPDRFEKEHLNPEDIVESFPNVDTMFRIFLTILIPHFTGERFLSFSKKLNSRNQSTVGQLWLYSLALWYLKMI